jgi:hypothetical protein
VSGEEPARSPSLTALEASMVELIARGDEFHGRPVSVIGVPMIEHEASYLFLSKEASIAFDTPSAIIIIGHADQLARLAMHNGKYVLVTGRFSRAERVASPGAIQIGRRAAGSIAIDDFVAWGDVMN